MISSLSLVRLRFVAYLQPPPVALVLLLLLLGSAGEAAAQIVPGWNTKQFTLERIDGDRVRLTREVEIEGEKGSPNEGQKFFADDVELNTRTGELTASGNVVFSTTDARISADSVVFNTRTKRGTFTNASGIASLGERGERDRSMFGTLEPDVYFYGEVIEKIDIDKYRITRGAFTTCVQPTPRWEIASGSSTVNLHDYALLNNAIIRVKDVPVFYLPVLYYPIQDDDRATGFLIPTYGRSTFRGQSLSNAFFWAISRNQDATFLHDWFMSRGQGGGTEYRYILSPQSQGNFRLYGLNENEGTTEESADPARTSYQVQANITQALPAGLRGRARVDYFSDIVSQQLFNNNLYQQTFSTRSYGGGVSGAWRGLSVSGQYQRTESFYNSNDSFVSGQAPGITASFNGRRLGKLPLYASVNSELSKVLWQQRSGSDVADFGIGKFDLLPSIRAPLSTLPFLSANASVGYRVTYFTESLNPATGRQIEEPVTRRYADLRGELVGPVFTRVFNPGTGFADRLKHVIEPAFTLQRITSIDNLKQIPTTASYEYVVGGVTRFTYGVTNRVLVRRGSDAAAARQGHVRPASRAPHGWHQPELLLQRAGEPVRPVLRLLLALQATQQLLHGRARHAGDAGAEPGYGLPHGVRPDRHRASTGGVRPEWRPAVADGGHLGGVEPAELPDRQPVHLEQLHPADDRAAPGRQHDRRHGAVQLRHRAPHDVEPALDRQLQRPVLWHRRRVPDLQLPRRVRREPGPAVQRVLHPGRHRQLLQLLRHLRRRELLTAATGEVK